MPVPAARSDCARVRAPCAPATALALLALGCAGCIGQRVIYPVLPTPDELAAFDAAGPPEVQSDALEARAMRVAGPYHVVLGDLLLVQLPPEVQPAQKATEGTTATSLEFKCRVKDPGVILLPMVGNVQVAGKTAAEIEEALSAEYQGYGGTRLDFAVNVVVSVAEYHTVQVCVIGAVNQPGNHDLRSDQQTVMGALMASGGIKTDRGAQAIKVIGADGAAQTLAVAQQDVPLGDLALQGGETIVVEPLPERQFCVYGLVKKSGVFEYPAPRRYNLMQVLAVAGGVDETAAPRYATIYRKRADGSVLGATFKIDGTSLTDASNVIVKDGDVIAVDHTQGSWLRQFFSQILGIRASASVTSTASPTL